MGLFDFFKRLKKEEKVTYNGTTFSASKSISNEDYQKKRESEVAWLESHYDLNSAKGILSIPERSDLPRPSFSDGVGFRSYTGDVDYYLRRKSAEYEESGNIGLAILCLKKSNAIRMNSRRGYRKDDYYTLVRLLARCGYVDEAKAEKEKIDDFFGDNDIDIVHLNGRGQANKTIKEAYEVGTNLLLMQTHGCSCPECAKYQGRVFSIYGKDSRFPPLPSAFYEFGGIHKGCTHAFYPFIEGASDPDLDYSLSIQKIQNRKYRKNIIAYSNRPFVDDRPQEDIDAALAKIEAEHLAMEKKKEADDHMIEREAKRGANQRDYNWLQTNLQDLCPKSFSGYMRMKNANTKNYQKIVETAKERGHIIN